MDIEQLAREWVNDGPSGHPQDQAGEWMFKKLVEAFKAGYEAHTQQKLNIASVSGKRPTEYQFGEWVYQMSLLGRVQYFGDGDWRYNKNKVTHEELKNIFMAASASGAVDKTVSDGFWCVEHDRFGNNKCKRQCELCEKDSAKP